MGVGSPHVVHAVSSCGMAGSALNADGSRMRIATKWSSQRLCPRVASAPHAGPLGASRHTHHPFCLAMTPSFPTSLVSFDRLAGDFDDAKKLAVRHPREHVAKIALRPEVGAG